MRTNAQAHRLQELPLDGNIHVGEVVQDKFNEDLVIFLAEIFDEGLRRELLSHLVGGETVLGERIVEVMDG